MAHHARTVSVGGGSASSSTSGDALPIIELHELAKHKTEESCWLVVDGFVLDVTHFHHPGGNDRLRDLAGLDATRFFHSIGHSMGAQRQLRSLCIGRLATLQGDGGGGAAGSNVGNDAGGERTDRTYDGGRGGGATPVQASAPSPNEPPLLAEPADGRRALKAGSTHRLARPGEHYWSTRRRGFLPARDPLKQLGEPYVVLQELVSILPMAIADGSFMERVRAQEARFSPLPAAIAAEQNLDVLERVHGLYGYIGKGYVHHTADAEGVRSVPSFLSAGWLAVSERLQRQPTVDYSDCVLNNWERIDPSAAITPENIRLLNRFTGLVDEEWFLKTHVIIESEASGVVTAIHDATHAIAQGSAAARGDTRWMERLLSSLSYLEQALSHVASNCLWIMFERAEDEGYLCEPEMFYHRFRPFISTWTALFEGAYEDDASLSALRGQLAMVERLAASESGLPDLSQHRDHLVGEIAKLQKRRKLAGPSGAMSTILPLCDAFLDVQMSSEVLGEMLQRFEAYMPLEHREMLSRIREQSLSARPLIMKLVETADEQAATLVDHFNAVVRRVLDFRWRHLSYIEQYVLKPSGEGARAHGTGGTPAFTYLNQHISDTEAALIPTAPSILPSTSANTLSGVSSANELYYYDGERELVADMADAEDGLGDGASPRHRSASADSGLPHMPRLWEVSDTVGLLPSGAPVGSSELPASWSAVVQLVNLLPSKCVPPSTFRSDVIRESTNLPASCDDLSSEPLMERGHAILAFILAGWQAAGWQTGHGAAAEHGHVRERRYTPNGYLASDDDMPSAMRPSTEDPPPAPLRNLFWQLCGRMQRGQRLSIVDLVLYNWKVPPDAAGNTAADEHVARKLGEGERSERSEGRPVPEASKVGSSKPASEKVLTPHAGRVVPLHRFLCVEEEDWFSRLHVALARECGPLLRAARHCFDAMSTSKLIAALYELSNSVEGLVQLHYAAGIGQPIGADVPKVRPNLLMQRLHRFLPLISDLPLSSADQRAARVFCATGIDQTLMLHLLGVDRRRWEERGEAESGRAHAIGTFREWQQSPRAMELPAAHRAHLEACCQRPSLRVEVERGLETRMIAVQDLSRLELAYNACVDMMLRYFTRRIELVRAMFGEDALRESWERERGKIQGARLKLLLERRTMDDYAAARAGRSPPPRPSYGQPGSQPGSRE